MSVGGRVAIGCGAAAAAFILLVGALAMWTVSSFTFLDDDSFDVCANSDVPLVRAAGLGDVVEVTRQLDEGEDINRADRDANTALGCAIPRGQTAVSHLLLARGADPNRDTGLGEYMEDPLHLAIRREQDPVIDALVAAGADVNRVDCKGTPLEAALARPDGALTKRLIAAGADADGRLDGVPPLVLATRNGDVETARLLLDNGADPNGRPGGRPAIRAASRGDSAILDLLLSKGAALEVPTGGSSSGRVMDDALDLAASNGHLQMVNRLLDAGADPNHDPHLSPLLRSLFYGRLDVAAVLLDRGADPNAGNVDGLTMFAISLGLDTVEVHTSTHGSSGTLPAGPPRSPALMGLLRRTFTPATQDMATPGTTTSTQPPSDGRLADCKNLIALLDELSDVEGMIALTRDPSLRRFDVPPLAIALITQSEAGVRILLEHGADPDRLTLDSYPLLYLAGVDCNVAAAQALLDRGADPTPITPGYEPVSPAIGPSTPPGTTDPGPTGTTVAPLPSVCPDVSALAP